MCGMKKKCQKPEALKGAPEECSPDQIRQCHGEAAGHPCVPAAECEHPEELKGKSGECSPEQIRKCHGRAAGHPCVTR